MRLETSAKNRLAWLFQGAFILLFLYFLSRANLGDIVNSLVAVEPLPIILALLVLPLFVWAKAARWGVILRDMGAPRISDWSLSIYYTIGLFLGGVTPGQAGDIAKGWYLRGNDVPLQIAVTSVVLDRVYDLLIMAVLGMLALLDYVDLVPPQLLLGAQALIVVLGGGSALLISQRVRDWLAQVFNRGFLQRLQIERLLSFRFSLISRSTPLLLGLTLLSIALNLLRGWFLFDALSLNIPLYSVFAVITLIAIFQVLPISIAGFGVREALLVITLQHYGYRTEDALSLSLLLLLLNIQQIVVGLVVSLFFPIPLEGR